METTLFYAFDERKKGNWRSGSDFNFSWNINPLLWGGYKVYRVKTRG